MNNNKVENGISKLQAIWKGYKTRIYLLQTRKEYEEIFNEIQQNFNTITTIEWPSNIICMPIIQEKKNVIPKKRFSEITEINETSSIPRLSEVKESVVEPHTHCDKDVIKVAGQKTDVNIACTCNKQVSCNDNYTIVNDINHDTTNHVITPLHTSNTDETISNIDININPCSHSPEYKLKEEVNSIEGYVDPGKDREILSPTEEYVDPGKDREILSPTEEYVEPGKDKEILSPTEEYVVKHQNNISSERDEIIVTESHRIDAHVNKHKTDSNKILNDFHDDVVGDEEEENVSTVVDSLEFIETSSRIIQRNGNNDVVLSKKHNILTDSWVTDKSFDINETDSNIDNDNEGELLKMKESLSMELLWIGQAINSRKVYLRMKNAT